MLKYRFFPSFCSARAKSIMHGRLAPRLCRADLQCLILFSCAGHVWYTTLDKNVLPNEPTSNKAVVAKMLVDQLIWAPFFSCCFFLFTNTLAVGASCLSLLRTGCSHACKRTCMQEKGVAVVSWAQTCSEYRLTCHVATGPS